MVQNSPEWPTSHVLPARNLFPNNIRDKKSRTVCQWAHALARPDEAESCVRGGAERVLTQTAAMAMLVGAQHLVIYHEVCKLILW